MSAANRVGSNSWCGTMRARNILDPASAIAAAAHLQHTTDLIVLPSLTSGCRYVAAIDESHQRFDLGLIKFERGHQDLAGDV